jgi:hypothetical protein
MLGIDVDVAVDRPRRGGASFVAHTSRAQYMGHQIPFRLGLQVLLGGGMVK